MFWKRGTNKLDMGKKQDVWEIEITTIDGDKVKLRDLIGENVKAVVMVNVASY